MRTQKTLPFVVLAQPRRTTTYASRQFHACLHTPLIILLLLESEPGSDAAPFLVRSRFRFGRLRSFDSCLLSVKRQTDIITL